ncbi:bacteriophage abortive infection AbiH family protein [Lactobacillus gasseri]|jgi:hypothetical protein|nr:MULTISPECIES: AbiH family protein [Lactobacillus]KDA98376.1 hypothetical protein LK7_009915 [Lactobacillus paragasseri K7]MCT7758451.1 bacteriophage abortive infection AbiH family protein [Lactobacillus gasseri]MCZ3494883.1 bacteriophage abortive infection AbiH family protein [Lactobacillus gasseri]MCZ3537668.1 bacteriophage abortive infection AbiH family protein [Lactobacillus gasseri]MCZ3540318.1 bacteriophage abortive infection AbiH family protein [Lactobacillus gasseri]
MQNNTLNELLIIGNGFDLQCKLKTKYTDFFSKKYGIDFLTEKYIEKFPEQTVIQCKQKAIDFFINVFKEKLYNLNVEKFIQSNSDSYGYLINYFKQIFRQNFSDFEPTLTNWDIIFISSYVLMSNSDKFQWVDIEKMIFKTVTIVFKNKKEIFSNSEFPNDQARMKFINIVQYCFKDNKDLSTSMLDSLKKFEKSFALYIKNLIYKSKDHYFKRSEKLLKYLTSSYNEEIVHLDVINFNYSLDENIVNQMIHEKRFSNITFNSWTNIHGVASWNDSYTRSQINKLHSNYKRLAPPIFGIDWHDISDTTNDIDFNDPRIIFTKSFRLIDNQVNNMRDKKHQFQKNINKIIFFGHSLGHADYSYFESLFDIYNIYDSNIELNFYYKKGSSDFLDRLSAQKTLEEIIKLLTSYGQTSTNQHGENIVNKLLLEQRLNLLPSPSINKGTL